MLEPSVLPPRRRVSPLMLAWIFGGAWLLSAMLSARGVRSLPSREHVPTQAWKPATTCAERERMTWDGERWRCSYLRHQRATLDYKAFSGGTVIGQ
jgi:hypothetical protein